MTLMERFASVFRRLEIPDNSQGSREAHVDLLVWTMFVDHHLALAENDALDELTKDLPWQSVTGLSDFVADSIARAREVLDDEEKSLAYLQQIGQRLGDEAKKRDAIKACEQIMASDGRMTEEEVKHLRAVSRAFGLL